MGKAKRLKRLANKQRKNLDIENAITRISKVVTGIETNDPFYKNRDLNIMLTNDADASETYSKGYTQEQIEFLRSWIEEKDIFTKYPKIHIYVLPSDKSFFLESVKEKWMTYMVNIKTGQPFAA